MFTALFDDKVVVVKRAVGPVVLVDRVTVPDVDVKLDVVDKTSLLFRAAAAEVSCTFPLVELTVVSQNPTEYAFARLFPEASEVIEIFPEPEVI